MGAMTLSKTTRNIMTLRIKKTAILCINGTQCNNKYSDIILIAAMLNVVYTEYRVVYGLSVIYA
jgi:hypothetical protein